MQKNEPATFKDEGFLAEGLGKKEVVIHKKWQI